MVIQEISYAVSYIPMIESDVNRLETIISNYMRDSSKINNDNYTINQECMRRELELCDTINKMLKDLPKEMVIKNVLKIP